ncbi:general odorant-binding protein 2-like [Battus philenor]|uniref:general odorant-binding protein 2-like n=1 Tax=Battus philenor TaxID=42288 RepID=UPI0035CEB261
MRIAVTTQGAVSAASDSLMDEGAALVELNEKYRGVYGGRGARGAGRGAHSEGGRHSEQPCVATQRPSSCASRGYPHARRPFVSCGGRRGTASGRSGRGMGVVTRITERSARPAASRASNSFIKVICFSSVAAQVVGTAEVMSHVTAHFGKTLDECREESGLTKDIMTEFSQFWSEEFEVVHRELGCALICMSNKFSLMQDDARMHHVNMHDYIRSFPDGESLSARMVQMIHGCEQQHDHEPDECTRVVRVAACFKRDARAAGIAPDLAMLEAVLDNYR